jgi:restriction endonuclease
VADPGEVSPAALHMILGPLLEALAEEWHRSPPRRAAAEDRLRDRLGRISGTVVLQPRCIWPRPRGGADSIATFYGHHDARTRTRCVVFTSARIDPATEALAADHGVLLVDRERLIRLLIEHETAVATEGDATEELAVAAG